MTEKNSMEMSTQTMLWRSTAFTLMKAVLLFMKLPLIFVLKVGQLKQIFKRNCTMWQLPVDSGLRRCPVWEVFERWKRIEPAKHCRHSSPLLLLFCQLCNTWVTISVFDYVVTFTLHFTMNWISWQIWISLWNTAENAKPCCKNAVFAAENHAP